MKRLILKSKNKKNNTQPKPLYNKFQAMFMSFYSMKLYVDVVRRWRGFGLVYVLFLFSIITIPYTTKVVNKLNWTANEYIIAPLEKLPPFSVHNGRAYFFGEMPYLVKNDRGEVISIIDTEGHIKQLPHLKYPMASILITKRAIHTSFQSLDLVMQQDISKRSSSVTPIEELGDDFSFIGANFVYDMRLKQLAKATLFGLYPGLCMFFSIMYIILLFPMGFIGQLMGRYFFKLELTFKQATRLLFVAITPQATLFLSLLALDALTQALRLISVVIVATYYCYGLLACRRERKFLVVQ